ncbi:MAG: DUF1631 family protein [Ketobacter sp.]
MYNNSTGNGNKALEAENSAPVRIGARLVIELLRIQAEDPPTDNIRLTPNRTKHALAVLKQKLIEVQRHATKNDVHCSVTQILAESCSGMEIALPIAEPDWGAVGLLDQLFDQLLTEQGLDQEARGWIEKLRLPILRYALLDYSFFFTPQNLVRRFLNQAYLILLSSTEKSRRVYREKLDVYIKRILNEFVDDAGDMNSICIEAQAWFAGQNEKVEKIEEQLKVLESARRKENVAEPRVVDELNRIASGKQLPKMVTEFLHGEWRRSMLHVSMREGESGSTWKRQIRITESIVEFCLDCVANDGGEQEKYRSFYPVLIKNIKALLESVADDQEALEATLEPLELALTAMLNGAIPPLTDTPALRHANTHVSSVEVKRVGQQALNQIEGLSEGDWLRMKTSEGTHELCRVTLKGVDQAPWVLVSQSGKTVAKKNSVQLAQGIEGGVVDVVKNTLYWDKGLESALNQLHAKWLQANEEQKREAARKRQAEAEARLRAAKEEEARKAALLLEPQEDKVDRVDATESRTEEILQNSALALEKTETEADEVGDFIAPRTISDHEMTAAMQAIEQIQVGGWIAQQTSEGELRCKLAVKIRGRDKLVFVNRVGIKILEIDKQELARLMVYGAVSILDTGSAFDSTLERVVRSIQKEKR